MGFGTLAANIIVFIAVLMLASGLIVVMNAYVQDTQESLTEQKTRLVNELRTQISIQTLAYDNVTLDVYVKNEGTTNLQLNTLDLYLDGNRISRDDTTVAIEPDTLTGGPTLWNPREVIKVSTDVTMNGTVTIRVVSDNSASDQEAISI